MLRRHKIRSEKYVGSSNHKKLQENTRKILKQVQDDKNTTFDFTDFINFTDLFMDFSTHSKTELTTLLKSLKSYRALEKFVGKRGRALFARSQSGIKTYRVEYFGEEE